MVSRVCEAQGGSDRGAGDGSRGGAGAGSGELPVTGMVLFGLILTGTLLGMLGVAIRRRVGHAG